MKALILLFLLISPPENDYQILFKKGLKSYNNKEFRSALELFKKSKNLYSHAKTSYYIACCYYRLERYYKAEEYAKLALLESPKLADFPYLYDIHFILNKSHLDLYPKTIIMTIEERSNRFLELNNIMQPRSKKMLISIDSTNIMYSRIADEINLLLMINKLYDFSPLPSDINYYTPNHQELILFKPIKKDTIK